MANIIPVGKVLCTATFAMRLLSFFMSDVVLYFSLGMQHILSLEAADHILFIAALCLRYQWSDWKKLLVLITAFTIGHSVTLALSTLSIISVPPSTELLIAVTILLTAINNLFVRNL